MFEKSNRQITLQCSMNLKALLVTYCFRANHPTFNGVKQQSFHCAHGHSRSGIWTEHREDGSSLLHDVWHLCWGNSNC